MTKISRRTIAIVLASIIALVVCAVPAYAYFTDKVDASGEKGIVLKYNGTIDENIPSGTLDKHITVTNTGDSDIMVDVRLVGAYSHNGVTVSVNGNDAWTCPPESVGTDSQVWTYVGDENNKGVLKPGESTDVNGAQTLVVDVEEADSSEFYDFSITVVGHYYPVYYDDQGNPRAYKASEIGEEN